MDEAWRARGGSEEVSNEQQMDVMAYHAVAPLVESIHATHLGCTRAISTV